MNPRLPVFKSLQKRGLIFLSFCTSDFQTDLNVLFWTSDFRTDLNVLFNDPEKRDAKDQQGGVFFSDDGDLSF
jgi:hypothetical protein